MNNGFYEFSRGKQETTTTSSVFPYTGSAIIFGSLIVTGSISATQGFTGSLFGTSSWATNSLTASFVTGSNVFGPFGSNSVVSASFAVSSSRAVTSSFAVSASWAPLNAGGSNTQIQFNSGSTSAGTGSFTFNYQSQSLQQGLSVTASGLYSHAQGFSTRAIGNYSHAEGSDTTASGSFSHAEGESGTTAQGQASHAEGRGTTALGRSSHAEGTGTTASGSYSHAEGQSTQAIGEASHAEGLSTITLGKYSHAEGWGTIAQGNYQHVQGQYNISSSVESAFIIGNGVTEGTRSNLVFAAGNTVQITGSLNVSGSITGSLFGTASFAVSSSRAVSSSFAISASWAENAPLSTLQQVLDNNHDLFDDNFFAGTGAGFDNGGISVNALGNNAGALNTGSNINALGNQTAVSNTGENVNALGNSAAIANIGSDVNALGSNAGYNNYGSKVNAFGNQAAYVNTGNSVNALGNNSANLNAGSDVNFLGEGTGGGNNGTNVNALGYYAGGSNYGHDVNALGRNALDRNTGNDVNAFGNGAGGVGNTFNNVNLFGESATADENGQTVLSKDGTIMARISTTNLTDSRKYTLQDGDGTLAFLDDIPNTGSFATTGSNTFTGTQTITGSNGRLIYRGTTSGVYPTNTLAEIHANDDYPWLERFYNDTFSTSSAVMAYFGQNDGRFVFHNESTQSIGLQVNGYSAENGLLVYSDKVAFVNNVEVTGSLLVSGSITGSLFGTASWATNAITASYITASNVYGPFGANSILSASYATTASYSKNLQISGSINNVDYIDFNTGSIVTQPVPGRLSWNDTDGTLDIGLKGGNVTLQIGQEEVARVVNKTGGNLLEADYRVVRVRSVAEGGAQGQRLAVVLAQANNDANSATTLGIVTENINVNQDGFITLSGQIRGINTTGTLQGETWVDGDVLYLSPTIPGHLTNIKPQAPQHTVIVGYVEYAHNNQGKIFVKIDNGYEIDELHNVSINTGSLTSGQLLVRSGSVWTNSNQLTGSYGLTGSLQATSFSGSFSGSGANLNSIPASAITGLNLSQIATGSVTASVSPTQFTVSSASVAEFTVTGTGVTLGSALTDTHRVTGSLNVSGAIDIVGNLTQGLAVTASGLYSHAEGSGTQAKGNYSHAEGQETISSGSYSHAEGYLTLASGSYSHAEGSATAAIGNYSHAEGEQTTAEGFSSHAEGVFSIASGDYSHAEGSGTLASGSSSHAEGNSTQAIGESSHAEGSTTIASGLNSHAEGEQTITEGQGSHAEGYTTYTVGAYSHAEGESAGAIGQGSHAEGSGTEAIGPNSHAEGASTISSGSYSHAEGESTQAIGQGSHAEGFWTVAAGSYQHVQGQYNISSSAQSAFIIGNGTSSGTRSNLVFASGSQFQITGSLSLQGLTSQSPLQISSGSTSLMFISSSGDIGIRTTTPSASLHIVGSGSFAGLHLQNLTTASLGVPQNTPSITLTGASFQSPSSSLNQWRIFGAGSSGASYSHNLTFQSITGPAQTVITPMTLTQNGGLSITNNLSAFSIGTTAGYTYATQANNSTTGITNFISTTNTFNPTSGTGVINYNNIAPTINQTGGANGISRGLFINPTLTSAADFRALENTRGNNLLNSTSGNTYVGLSTNTGTARLQVRGTGATSSTNNLLLQNSSLTNLLTVRDDGSTILSGSLTISGSATIVGGSITMPDRPAFRVTGSASTDRTATTTLSGSAVGIDYNQGGYYNNTNGTFTAPIAGLYHIYLNARVGSANSQMQAIVYKNTNIVQLMWEAPGLAASTHFGVSGIVNLAVNDTLQLRVTVGSIQFDGNDSWGAAYIG